jgi:hypothetical protein
MGMVVRMFFPIVVVFVPMSMSMFMFVALLAWFSDGNPISVSASASITHNILIFDF